jgi:uncharacterized protein YndB with AHSA1/START domain
MVPKFQRTFSFLRLASRFAGRSRLRRWLCAIGLVVLTSTAWADHTAHNDQVSTDLKNRSPEMHWPDDLKPDHADVFAHNEIVIDAGCREVWSQLIDAKAWPSWYANASNVNIAGPGGELSAGTEFTWSTFGFAIHSEVSEFVPDSRVSWSADGKGVRAYHAWILLADGRRCRVVTEEAGSGEGVVAARESNPAYLHDGHAVWLDDLKRSVEGRVSGSTGSIASAHS